MMTRLLAGSLFVCFLAPAASLAAPAAGKARLALSMGRVFVETKGARRDGKAGDALADGDAVETAKGATAVVEFPDRSQLKLRELSRVAVKLPAADSALSEVLLSFGGVFAKVAKQGLGAEFRVRTESAVASVRGTQFFTAFGRKKDVWLCVNEGAVDVTTSASEKAVRVPAGKGILIKSGVEPTQPRPFEWTKKLNWNMDPGQGAVADKTSLDKAYSDLLDQDYR